MNIISAKLHRRIEAVDSLLCVGLDPDPATIPARYRISSRPLFEFCRDIADATAGYTAAFKPNAAFFEAQGAGGAEQLEQLAHHLREAHPDVVTIYDGKRADTSNTNTAYVAGIFDRLRFDAVTLHPYLGSEALEPFLSREDKACIVLCRTSNPGAREVQDLDCGGKPLWYRVAEKVTREWDRDGNCWLVVGATYPAEMATLRALAPHTTFLVPGIGAQGGDLDAVLRAGLDAAGRGLLISSSRAILHSSDPAQTARETRDAINRGRSGHQGERP